MVTSNANPIIIPDFLDVDFNAQAQRTGNLLGCIPRNFSQEPLGAIRPMYGAAAPNEIIAEADLDGICDQKDAEGSWIAELIWHIFKQIMGSCVTDAAAQGHQIKQVEALGPDLLTLLSPNSVYKIAGSSPNSGSNLSTVLRQSSKVGFLPLPIGEQINKFEFAHTMEENEDFYSKYPTGWNDTSKMFRFDESMDIENLQELWSAVVNNRILMYARDGHCILIVKIIGRGNNRKFVYINSWGQWGVAINARFAYGAGYDSQSKAARVAAGSIALGSIILPDRTLLVPQPI